MMLTRTIIALSFVIYALSAPPQKRQFDFLKSLLGGGGDGGSGLSSLTGMSETLSCRVGGKKVLFLGDEEFLVTAIRVEALKVGKEALRHAHGGVRNREKQNLPSRHVRWRTGVRLREHE
ncbi:hypothetical protein EDB86DRAFT_2828924 [Lactarius hatsudake]|nr:hypothetical protein EDB86DRAFT_2828924 [Lactarius hatsudake]